MTNIYTNANVVNIDTIVKRPRTKSVQKFAKIKQRGREKQE